MSDELKLKIIQELSKGNVRIGQLIRFFCNLVEEDML